MKGDNLKTKSGIEMRAEAARLAAAAADPVEQARRVLAGHEHVIENARRSFVDMGRALLAIRTERLYANEYSAFGEYCDARWDVSEAYANRVILAALVAIKATPIGVEINSEAQARELADLADKPEQLRQVWDEATRRAAGGRVTAALIKEVRKAVDPPAADALEGELINKTSTGGVPVDEEPAVSGTSAGPVGATSPADGSGAKDSPIDQTPPSDAADDVHVPVRAGAEEGQSETDHRESHPGDAAGDVPPDVDGDEAEAGTVDLPSVPGPAEGERQAKPGVSAPAAPAPKRTEDDDPERVRREMRERMTERFCESVVTLTQGVGNQDPAKWLNEVYLPGVYKMRGLPRVDECFTPSSIKGLAAQLYALADHMYETGMELL